MADKDFDAWNNIKKSIDDFGSVQGYERIFIKERQVWYVKLGLNIGFEQNGKIDFKRPVLVVRKIGSLFLAIPMTTKGKQNQYQYKLYSPPFHIRSWLLLSQVKTLDKKRFIEYVGTIPKIEFAKIKNLLREYYFPKDS